MILVLLQDFICSWRGRRVPKEKNCFVFGQLLNSSNLARETGSGQTVGWQIQVALRSCPALGPGETTARSCLAFLSWRAVPATLVGEWRRREEGLEAAVGGAGRGSPTHRVPRTEAGERGSLRRQSAWRADTRRPHQAMGRSRSPQLPPLVLLLLVLSLWLAVGAGKCRPCIHSARTLWVYRTGGAKSIGGVLAVRLSSLGNWSRKSRRGWFPSLYGCRRGPSKSWPPRLLLAPGSISSLF